MPQEEGERFGRRKGTDGVRKFCHMQRDVLVDHISAENCKHMRVDNTAVAADLSSPCPVRVYIYNGKRSKATNLRVKHRILRKGSTCSMHIPR